MGLMGSYYASNREMDASEWCIRNKIFVSPISDKKNSNKWYLEIELNGKINRSKESFGKVVIWEKLYEYYLYYYNKYND